MRKVLIIRSVSFLLAAAVCVMIFFFSAQKAPKSADTSKGFIVSICTIFYPDYNEKTEAQKLRLIESFQLPVRKAAHFSVYALLGVCAFFAAASFNDTSFRKRYIMSLAFCLLYAASDEIHQRFVPGRSCQITDVGIDFFGALVATVVCILIVRKTKLKYDLRVKKYE